MDSHGSKRGGERKGDVDDRVQLMEYGGRWGGTTPFAKRNEQPVVYVCAAACACFYKDLSTARCKPGEMLGVNVRDNKAEIKGNGGEFLEEGGGDREKWQTWRFLG